MEQRLEARREAGSTCRASAWRRFHLRRSTRTAVLFASACKPARVAYESDSSGMRLAAATAACRLHVGPLQRSFQNDLCGRCVTQACGVAPGLSVLPPRPAPGAGAWVNVSLSLQMSGSFRLQYHLCARCTFACFRPSTTCPSQ